MPTASSPLVPPSLPPSSWTFAENNGEREIKMEGEEKKQRGRKMDSSPEERAVCALQKAAVRYVPYFIVYTFKKIGPKVW